MKKKIVVIDDDKNILHLIKVVLESEGYQVETFAGALGATSKVLDFNPDLMLIDVNMPGLSGLGFIEIVKKLTNHRPIPIVFHSSMEEEKLQNLVVQHEAAGYIPKGASVPQLIAKVHNFLTTPVPKRFAKQSFSFKDKEA